ncbi:hypothetical protein LX32DRAFT_318830 [Colletotrichum zoysiae]|uniref:Uncharacterized protein n=1 Tax=Colletotrichum zoysiae TaxID=1216348 RepID=A0AAD9H182_9PEZI|nr:hypothetical protein LX32DRAFT_318830 [Colletotrichum zoysiae]
MGSVVIWLKRTHLVTIHKPRGRFPLVPGCSLHSGRGDSRVFDAVDLAGLRNTIPAHGPATILYRSNWTWSIIKIKSHDSYNSPLPLLPTKQAHLSGDAALMMQHRIRSVLSARLYGPDGLFFFFFFLVRRYFGNFALLFKNLGTSSSRLSKHRTSQPRVKQKAVFGLLELLGGE